MGRFSVLPSLLLTGMALGLPVIASARAGSDRLPDYRPVPGWPKVPGDVKLGPVSAVATDASDRVYVAHRGKKPVLVFDAEGQFIRSWGDREIDTAHGLRVDPRGNVWVIDIGGHRVLKFSPTGKLLLALGKRGAKGASSKAVQPPLISKC
jgi:DNA-binding beta-propeller fold protein YncE